MYRRVSINGLEGYILNQSHWHSEQRNAIAKNYLSQLNEQYKEKDVVFALDSHNPNGFFYTTFFKGVEVFRIQKNHISFTLKGNQCELDKISNKDYLSFKNIPDYTPNFDTLNKIITDTLAHYGINNYTVDVPYKRVIFHKENLMVSPIQMHIYGYVSHLLVRKNGTLFYVIAGFAFNEETKREELFFLTRGLEKELYYPQQYYYYKKVGK